MKKWFGNKNDTDSYEEWEDLDMIEDEDGGEYYAEEESDEYYGEEEDGGYYEAGEDGEEYYEAEEEFYEEEDGFYAEDYAGEDSDLEEMAEEDLEDLSADEDEEEDELPWGALTGMNLFEKMWYKLGHMSIMDRVMVTTGVLVLILAMVTGVVYGSSRILASQVSSFDTVGSQLDGIHLIGESGLLAVGDAELARLEAANLVEDEEAIYDEEDYSGEVVVSLNMTSIMKDLKIKFVNKRTGKLVANVPFSVSVKAPDGTLSTWTDDDMDGIIYKKDIAHGNYVVELQALTDEKYKDYGLESGSKSVKVKETLDYEKVDVSDEVKSEAEIDASKEDTKVNETEEESKLKDTVAFVETTKTFIGNTYNEIKKDAVVDPMTQVHSGVFTRLVSDGDASGGDPTTPTTPPTTPPAPEKKLTLSPSSLTGDIGGTATITATLENFAAGTVPQWNSDNKAVATVDANGKVTYVGAGTTTITCSADGLTATCSVTVNSPAYTAGTVSIKETSLSLIAGGSAQKLTAQISGFKPDSKKLVQEWTSSKPEVAAVDKTTGTVTPKAAGEAEIKLKVYFEDNSAVSVTSAACKVTVSAGRTLKFANTSLNVYMGGAANLSFSLTPENTSLKAENFAVVSSDNSIATVKMAADFKSVVVTPVKKGDVTVTLTYKESASAAPVQSTCKISVKTSDPTKDTTTRLKDKAGHELFVLEDAANNKYREAKYADYYKYDKFYYTTGEEYKYTGWTTINGKVYYYKADGKYVTGEQVIQGAKYNFASDGTLVTGSGVMGIDVSKWNGSIDWKAVKNSGVSYVIIRCGYRGSSAGSLIEDPKFKANIKGATDAGLKVGVYFFSQAINEVEAIEEASMVLGLIKNYKISYPVFLDVEASGGRADGISKSTRTAVIKAFCETIQNSGYTAGVYANKSWLTTKIDAGQLGKYKIWLAQYASKPTYSGRYDMWQYTSTGKINGISGNVDLNLSYLGY